MDEPQKPSSASLFNISESLLSAILIFLILNLIDRTDYSSETNPDYFKVSDSVLTSIAFCILELLALLAALIFIKTAKSGPRSYLIIGFALFLIDVIFFIIEASTFYHQYFWDQDSLYPYYTEERIKQNNYQVVIEVLLRVGGLGTLMALVLQK